MNLSTCCDIGVVVVGGGVVPLTYRPVFTMPYENKMLYITNAKEIVINPLCAEA